MNVPVITITPTRSRYEIIDVSNTDITVDVSMLTKAGSLYFNATEISKQFGKSPADFLKTKETKEYIKALSHYDNCHSEDLVRVQNGGKYRGTWLHNELATEFAGWLSAPFRVHLHKWIEQRIQDEASRKRLRDEARTGFLPLTNAIQAAHKEPKGYHYSNECNLINKLVLGMSSKQFKAQHQIESVRDGCDVFQLYLFDKLQRINTALIELGKGYDERKQALAILVNREALEVF